MQLVLTACGLGAHCAKEPRTFVGRNHQIGSLSCREMFPLWYLKNRIKITSRARLQMICSNGKRNAAAEDQLRKSWAALWLHACLSLAQSTLVASGVTRQLAPTRCPTCGQWSCCATATITKLSKLLVAELSCCHLVRNMRVPGETRKEEFLVRARLGIGASFMTESLANA